MKNPNPQTPQAKKEKPSTSRHQEGNEAEKRAQAKKEEATSPNKCFHCKSPIRYCNSPKVFVCTKCDHTCDYYGQPDFYDTIIHSEQWEKWEDSEPPFDVVCSRETGYLSPDHWKEFVTFIQSNYGN